MSGLADISALADKMVQGFFVSSTIALVFDRKGIGSILDRKNLMDAVKLGTASHVYDSVLKAPVQAVVGRVMP